MKKHLLYIGIFVLLLFVNGKDGISQIADTVSGKPYYILEGIVQNGDTIGRVNINEIIVFPEIKFDNKRKRRKYTKLIRDLKQVYPYAMKARNILIEMEWEFRKLESEKAKKEYVKRVEQI